MVVRLAINGFGRIGRTVLRAAIESHREDVQIVAMNNRSNLETCAHLLRYDSVHGRFHHDVKIVDGGFEIDGKFIHVTSESDPAKIKWQDLGIDVVLECTGVFTSKEKAELYLQTGAKRVLVSAPSDGADFTMVYGVNHKDLPKDAVVISNGSCTTNCLAPVVKILDESIGIEDGFVTTVHSYTGDQPTLDRTHKDLYRARAAAMSMIPTKTGAAKAVGLVLPHMAGRLDGVAIRVPTPNVSLIDLTFNAKRETKIEDINHLMQDAAQGSMKGILGYNAEKLVSCDFVHDPHSSIFHADQTRVINKRLCRVLAWYDNEWGFSNRMLDSAAWIAQHTAL